MIITVFGDTVLKPGKEQAEAKLVEELDPIVRAMPGFISTTPMSARTARRSESSGSILGSPSMSG
jgi:antibiotic biosynthesis monooxygenase (ABM) superfamily enzyme